VIIVIDGTAYETVEGEADETSEPLPQPDAVVPDEPTPEPAAGAVTSPRPANAAEVYTALTADVVEGAAPLTVNFAGELVGGPDDSQEFYCVESMFEYGDGIAQSAIPDCVEWEPGIDVQRRFTSNYIYDEPGEYQVTFSLAGVESEPVTIVVTGDEAGEVQPADAFDEPGSTMAQTTPASPDQSGSPESSGETGTTNCVLGMLSLAVLGLAFALWRKGDVTISG
jgi:hypothetical protein